MDALLECAGLTWDVGGARIIDAVDLTVAPGEFVALVGPNGAGKTSLLNLITGLVRPARGQIRLNGVDITGEPPHRRARRGIARTFQSATLFPTMTVAEHVELAARVGRTRATVTEVLDQVRLGQRASAPAGALSHGDKRKLEIALLLAGPRGTEGRGLLLLDEPMAGVAAEEVDTLVAVIREAHRDSGAAVLMVEHHMEVLMSLADRVAVLHNGALLAIGTPDHVMAQADVQDAYLGAAR
ncbi:MAG TPA: ABC transporter ATP-binding protein [Pseudonocardiaceae bacterium]|nr:ABC transporter ATP-binding protein [Pseudonocardiaceae bacterium]